MAQIVYKKSQLRENEAVGDIISIHDDDVELTGAGYLQFGIRKVKGTAKEVQDLLSGLMPEQKEVKMWQNSDTLEWLEIKEEPKYMFSVADVETELDDANVETDLAGYNVFQSTEAGVYDNTSPIGTISCGPNDDPCCTYTTIDLPDNTYFFVVTAFDNDNNESGYSNEVTKRIDTTPPTAPKSLLIEAIELAIQSLERFKSYFSMLEIQ